MVCSPQQSPFDAQASEQPAAPRAGRPLGPLALSLLKVLRADPCTAAEAATAVNADTTRVVRQLSRLVAARQVRVSQRIVRPPARRPVSVYAVCALRDESADCNSLAAALSAWSRPLAAIADQR